MPGSRGFAHCQVQAYEPASGLLRERVEDQLHAFAEMLVLGAPVIVLLSALLGYILARKALAPVAQLTAAAQTITASRLSDRLAAYDPHGKSSQFAKW